MTTEIERIAVTALEELRREFLGPVATAKFIEATFARIQAAREAQSQVDCLAQGDEAFQARVAPWMQECFGEAIAKDVRERGDRFLEESLELLQANGYDKSRVATLVEYVWGRPVGVPAQEVGGVMVTLAAYCLATCIDMHEAGETELTRISEPAIVERIRVKQRSKRDIHSPLPAAPAREALQQSSSDCAMREGEAVHQWRYVDGYLNTERWQDGAPDEDNRRYAEVTRARIETRTLWTHPAPRAEVEDARDDPFTDTSFDKMWAWKRDEGVEGLDDECAAMHRGFTWAVEYLRRYSKLEATRKRLSRAASTAQAPQRFAPSEAGGEGK